MSPVQPASPEVIENPVVQEPRSASRCNVYLYCIAVLAILGTAAAGVAGLGPLDDHRFVATLFQGKELGFYVVPELGRFFPLVAQEYVLASHLFSPSAGLFYGISLAKVLVCGLMLLRCLVLTGAPNWAVAVFWSMVVLSAGIANTVYRLSAGELSALLLLLIFAWSNLAGPDGGHSSPRNAQGVYTIGVLAFFLALFHKELIFVFGLVFGTAEVLRSRFTRQMRPPWRIVAVLILSACYIFGYGFWRWHVSGPDGSYLAFSTPSRWILFEQFGTTDPFLIFVLFPVTIIRGVWLIRRPAQQTVFDSFLVAACAYVAAYLALGIYSAYYLLPAYGFAACGMAGLLARQLPFSARAVIGGLSVICWVNTLPIVVSDLTAYKAISSNHYRFVRFLSQRLGTQETPDAAPRNLVLVGVSPGSGVELLVSLKTFLTASGVAGNSFRVKGALASDNEAITLHYYGAKEVPGLAADVGDLMIYNPYQQIPTPPPLRAPSLREVYRSESEWAPPRWLAWHWAKACIFDSGGCTPNAHQAMRYTGYAAMQVERSPVAVSPAPLESPSYRLGPLELPPRVRAGSARRLNVSVENTGTETWPASGSLMAGMFVNMSYRWFDAGGRQVLEGDRAPLPESMRPGDTAVVSMLIKFPAKPGHYRLVVGPVQEGVRWFEGGSGREMDAY